MKEAVDLLLEQITKEEQETSRRVKALEGDIAELRAATTKKVSALKFALASICQHEHGTYDDHEFYSGSYDTYNVRKCNACDKVIER